MAKETQKNTGKNDVENVKSETKTDNIRQFKFQKNINHYKKGDILNVAKINKLLQKWIDEQIVTEIKK